MDWTIESAKEHLEAELQIARATIADLQAQVKAEHAALVEQLKIKVHFCDDLEAELQAAHAVVKAAEQYHEIAEELILMDHASIAEIDELSSAFDVLEKALAAYRAHAAKEKQAE